MLSFQPRQLNPSRRSWTEGWVRPLRWEETDSERIGMASKKKPPARKSKRLSTAQIVFLVLTVVIILSFVLSLVHI